MSSGRWPKRVAIAGGTCVALGLGVVGASSVLKGNEPAIATCASSTTVRVAAPAAIATTVDDLTRSAEAGSCIDYQVSTVSSYDQDQQLTSGAPGPDVWISDSSLWTQDVSTALGSSAPSPGPTIATSPVVVAVPHSLKTQRWATGTPTWSALLAMDVPLTVLNPQASTPTIMALADANTQIRTDNDRTTYFLAMLRLTRSALPRAELMTHAAEGSRTARAFVASEQEIVAYNSDHETAPLSAVAPASGAAQLTYQVLYPHRSTPLPDKARDLLEKTLTSSDAKSAFCQAGFRVPDSNPPAGSPVAADVVLSKAPSDRIRTSTLTSWNDLGRDDRMLVAVDASGSMGDPVDANGTSRMSLFQGVARLALAALPQTGQMGALAFSTALPGGYKWFSDGVRPLPVVKGQLLKAVGDAMSYVQQHGDTPLYDATWAAYDYMTKSYDPKYVNAVVVLTDGKNDNPDGTLDLSTLLGRLKAAYNKDKPVKIVTISLSRETDPDALKSISAATGGLFYQVDKPEQITGVFIDAFLHRGTPLPAG
ncbi:hypothetical protein AZH51_18090 [Branchiibius sp. NY16-3462-2]|nr:hypothetical protein AZH51_18090 [Branchiibius sp. NY16-3462-2]